LIVKRKNKTSKDLYVKDGNVNSKEDLCIEAP